MSQVTLTFSVPEEHDAMLDAVNGAAWRGVVQALDEALRQALKYDDDPPETVHEALADVRTQLHRECEAAGLRLWD